MTRTEALRKLYKKITNEEAPVGANTTTEALQKVYEALTNDTTHHINVTEIIEDLATNWDSGGGGGSSDFSTATVTTVCNADVTGRVGYVPRPVDDGELGEGAPAMAYNGLDASANSTRINKVLLYKGAAYLTLNVAYLTLNVTPSGISGAITDLGDGDYLITGDCTITIS